MPVGMAEQGYVAVYLSGQAQWDDEEPVAVSA
jgi:hypothetical protein